jgi:CheY-like chemotaxis protein
MADSRFRILLIEDNLGDVRFIEEILQELEVRNCQLIAVSRLRDGLTRVESYSPDIILLDLSLPDSIGLDTFYTMFGAHPHLPIIVLTGMKDEDVALQAIRSGAQDYLVKGKFDEVLLYRAMRYAIERKRNEAALLESEEKYRVSQAQLQKLAARLQDVR